MSHPLIKTEYLSSLLMFELNDLLCRQRTIFIWIGASQQASFYKIYIYRVHLINRVTSYGGLPVWLLTHM